MINKIQQPFSLLYMILRFGKLRHSGRDFNMERDEQLRDLQDFIPAKTSFTKITGLDSIKSVLIKNRYLRSLLSQTAFVKDSITPHGGHLHAPFLNISYIRIPKSASTSLSSLILEAIYPDLKSKNLTATQVNFLADANLRRHVSSDDSADIFFTVARNPYARIVSVYRDFFGETADDHIYEDYLFGILPRTLTFHDFVRRIEAIPDLLQDPHLKPQHYFVDFYKRKNPNVVILNLEKLDQLQSFLFLYDLEIPYLNASRSAYDYRSYYDMETFQWVSRIYKRDLQMFGYEQESRDLQRYVQSKG